MNTAESIKLRAQSMTLKNLIELYRLCRSAKHQLYICSKKTMCKIKDLIELETFRMANWEKECLIVIEGKEAGTLVQKARSIISNSRAGTQ
ncbi:general stress protein [Bacillus sonorensis]|uniref:general stress protein n=1 Tax=Bacillus sonorensis TaxID=119858 RepID=UPI00227EE3E4|nr:general stress protein [Bacillus sonorensis]MCY8089182.1 general stress protein [Bacillus sonorensis]